MKRSTRGQCLAIALRLIDRQLALAPLHLLARGAQDALEHGGSVSVLSGGALPRSAPPGGVPAGAARAQGAGVGITPRAYARIADAHVAASAGAYLSVAST